MIALLLLASLGRAEGPSTEPSTYSRLFGDEPGGVTAVQSEAPSSSPWRTIGPAALGVVGIFCLWRLRATTPRIAAGKPLEVICRQPLGDRNALVLLEVIDADGERRRLLVGTGAGAPCLVADLGQAPGPSVAEEVLAERRSESYASHAARRGGST